MIQEQELPANVDTNITHQNKDTNKKSYLLGGAYIVGLSGVAAVTAGYIATRISKRKSLEYYKDLNMEPKITLESPTALALRALAYSTVLTVGVFSIAIFCTCKWFDIRSLEDLRKTVRKYSRNSNRIPEGRTEFENLSDFLQYLDETYKSDSAKSKKS